MVCNWNFVKRTLLLLLLITINPALTPTLTATPPFPTRVHTPTLAPTQLVQAPEFLL